MQIDKKIAVLHRYPPRLVVATNASFLEFLKRLATQFKQVYYLTYREKDMEPIEDISIARIPLSFDRWNNSDKFIKTYLWILLTPIILFFYKKKLGIEIVYCDDSVPYYGFLIKLLNPDLKVIIRLGDLQSAYELADKSQTLFKLAQKLEVFMWNLVDGVIPISQAMADYLVKLGIPKHKLAVVEESINLDAVWPEQPQYKSDKFEILFHGSLVKCKGVETLLAAYKIFSQDKQGKVGLIIAGGGSESENLKNLSSTLQLENVEFTGSYSTPEVLDNLHVFDRAAISVVMRSSNFANNYVVTTCLLENWAHKKAVIVPNLQSFVNVVKSGDNGLFFVPDDVQNLAAQLEYAYTHQELLLALGEHGFETAKKIFKHTEIADKMVDALTRFVCINPAQPNKYNGK